MNALHRSNLARVASSTDRIVYILDDSLTVCKAIGQMLTGPGFSVREFTRVEALETALTIVSPDVILLDLALGECDAVEVIRRLAAAHFGGAIMLMSGTHNAETLAEVEKIGTHHGMVMLPFLQKPFRPEQIKSRLALVTPRASVSDSGTDLEKALRNNWLELWYQPKIDLTSRLVCGAEALARVRHPERGILLPPAFLPPPADALHTPLADFVIRRALADWMILAESEITTRLSINMPLSIFETQAFVRKLRRYLPKHAKFPGLIIELTESEVIRDPDFAREVATQLKLYKVGIAIDDFGRGHSTLERLQELPFCELKIDRKHVHGCSNDKNKYALCQSIITLAHRMNITVVAEGVETAADVRCLKEMKCDVVQGFFFAKAMEKEEYMKVLLSRVVDKTSEIANFD